MAGKVHIEWQESAERLEELYQAEDEKQKRTRLHALWLVRGGRSVKESAEIVGVHRATVHEWLTWYEQGGVAAVLARRRGGQGGPERRLTPEQEAELVEKAKKGELRTIWDGVAWAEQAHGVAYTYQGMHWVCERLGLKKKGPRAKSPKASDPEQTAWKKGGSLTSWPRPA